MRNQLNNLPEEVKANNAEIIEVLTRAIDAMEGNELNKINDAAAELYSLVGEREECEDMLDFDIAYEVIQNANDFHDVYCLMRFVKNIFDYDFLYLDAYGNFQTVDGDYIEMIIEEILDNLEA